MSHQNQRGRPPRRFRNVYVGLAALLMALTALIGSPDASIARAGTAAGALTFSNTPFTLPEGESEPDTSVGPTGTMVIVGPQWLLQLPLGAHLWTGPFGSTPTFRGLVDAD